MAKAAKSGATMDALAVEMAAIDSITPYARNPRRNAAAIAKVSASLKEFGWRQPIVVDPFAGSGSTLLACEASGRRAALLEIDPQYCDVIVSRWESLTGQQAVRP